MKCFNCDEEGHMAFECHREASTTRHRPAGILTPHRPGRPPTDDYLTALAELGIVRNANAARVLAVTCPWCGSGPRDRCVNRALGTPAAFHEKRWQEAGLEPPRRPALADAARRQVDEMRAQESKVKLT